MKLSVTLTDSTYTADSATENRIRREALIYESYRIVGFEVVSKLPHRANVRKGKESFNNERLIHEM